MKRSAATRQLSVLVGLAVTLTCFAPAVAAAADPGPELRVPLPTSPVPTDVIAASGTNILAKGKTLQLSTDNGQTWEPAAVADREDIWADLVDSAKAVFLDFESNSVDVFDLANNDDTRYALPSSAGLLAANSQTAVVFDPEMVQLAAVDLVSGQATTLADDYIPSDPTGWDSNDETEGYVAVGEQGAALVTNFILDGKQTFTEIDPLPLNGTFGGDVFRVSGYVPGVWVVGDRVEYVKRVSTAVSLCSRPIDGAGETCTKMATLGSASQSVGADRSGDVIRLELNGVEYLWEAGALKKVAYTGSYALWEGLGDPTRPLLRVQNGTTGGIFTALASGSTAKTFDDFGVPTKPYPLDLTADRLAGLDQRGSVWNRSVTSTSIGDETTLPGAADWVSASAGRTVTGNQGSLTFYDRSVKKAAATITGSLADASGPYALVMSKGTGSLRTSSGPVAATNPKAIFGSRYITSLDAKTARILDAATEQLPFDISLAPLDGTWAPSMTRMWGDWVVVNMDLNSTGSNDEELYDAHAYHRTAAEGGWGWTYFGGAVVAMGDGVAVVYDSSSQHYVLWNYVTNDRTNLDEDAWQPALNDANGLAYADDDEIVVTTVPGAGTSAPRLLGTVAPASFNPNAGAWKPEFDATKPLAAGTLEITHGTGENLVVDRVLTLPASTDGSLRGVAWDGRNEAGEWVADGAYTWTLKTADAQDAAKVLVAIDGTSAASGTVTVKTANLGTVTAVTPKVSDTTPSVDQTLNAITGTWKPATVQFAYQWYRDTTAIPAATAAMYKVQPADSGHTLKVKVTGSCPGTGDFCRGYVTASATSTATSKVALATITPATAPALDVTAPVVGKPVTGAVVPWGPDPVALSYQWYKVNAKGKAYAIANAKASTFTPTGAEVGYKLKLKVTGTKAGYTSKSVYSPLTGKVAVAAFTSVADPTVTGSVKLGMPLTAVPGATDPSATYAYQWYRGSSAISKATASTYKTTSSDLGKQLKVKVTYGRSGYASVAKYSALTSAIEPGLVAVTPKLNDTTPVVGQVLKITEATGIGAWTPADATPAYQWYRDAAAIPGATSSTYEVQASDLGKAVTVKVTGAKDGYVAVAKTSAASSKVAKGTFATKPAPTIDGLVDNTANVGHVLTAVPGDWSPTPTSFTYAWYRSGTAITGQTAATYTLASGDVGKLITVKVTALRGGFTSASAISAASGPIVA